jgi:hypothetical protein
MRRGRPRTCRHDFPVTGPPPRCACAAATPPSGARAPPARARPARSQRTRRGRLLRRPGAPCPPPAARSLDARLGRRGAGAEAGSRAPAQLPALRLGPAPFPPARPGPLPSGSARTPALRLGPAPALRPLRPGGVYGRLPAGFPYTGRLPVYGRLPAGFPYTGRLPVHPAAGVRACSAWTASTPPAIPAHASPRPPAIPAHASPRPPAIPARPVRARLSQRSTPTSAQCPWEQTQAHGCRTSSPASPRPFLHTQPLAPCSRATEAVAPRSGGGRPRPGQPIHTSRHGPAEPRVRPGPQSGRAVGGAAESGRSAHSTSAGRARRAVWSGPGRS